MPSTHTLARPLLSAPPASAEVCFSHQFTVRLPHHAGPVKACADLRVHLGVPEVDRVTIFPAGAMFATLEPRSDAFRRALREIRGPEYDRIRPDDLSERWTSLEDNNLCSNAYTFRHRDGSPAAIAGHVYNGDREDVRRDLQLKADGAGMILSFPTDLPSWWFPGRTTLVLFVPADAGAARGMAA